MNPFVFIILATLRQVSCDTADEARNLSVDFIAQGKTFILLKYDLRAAVYKPMEVKSL